MFRQFPIGALLCFVALGCESGEKSFSHSADFAGDTVGRHGANEEPLAHYEHWKNPIDGPLPFASVVYSFSPGSGAGFGSSSFPDIVLGMPVNGSPLSGSLDVLSLGTQGEIILGFGDRMIVDGPGKDFVVFENPFWPGGDPGNVFAELGEVSVSMDGENWDVFACNPEVEEVGMWEGCAGWTPTFDFQLDGALLNPDWSGGDGFDLQELGVEAAKYVRIRDLSTGGPSPSAGFDLDALGMVWWDFEN